MSRLLCAYADGSILETIALKYAMIPPFLLLQKPHKTSKPKDHIRCLECRMKLWEAGDMDALLHEGRSTILQLVYKVHRRPNWHRPLPN